MTEEITNLVLLQHMQAMKSDLQRQIGGLDKRLIRVENGLAVLRTDMERGFAEARQHRKELQEDLDATINMLMKHDKKLARL